MNNLVKRTITGIIFVTAILSAVYLSPFTLVAIFSLITIFTLKEFYEIITTKNISPQKIIGVIISIVLILTTFFINNSHISSKYLFFIPLLIIILFISELYRNKPNPLINISTTLFGIIYIAVPFSIVNYITFSDHQFTPNLLISILTINWVYDSVAYLVGVKCGKNKLFERISPQKSWEGTIGGALFACVAAIGLSHILNVFDPINLMIISIIIIVTGTLGDLIESMLKRSLNLKDTSSILPGHGGLLDRFDSLLFSIPSVYLYIQLINL